MHEHDDHTVARAIRPAGVPTRRREDPVARQMRIAELEQRHALGLRLFEEGAAPPDDNEDAKARGAVDRWADVTDVADDPTLDLATADEVARMFRVSKRTVYRLAQAGAIPAPCYRLTRKNVFWSRRACQEALRRFITPVEVRT